MKILELRFKNLNSLYGEWVIDFTAAEYLSNGIFALTGPTGAGKSTILDAICLALYGATPRLGKITKSGNEIMSRQTGECYAEVVFESQAGRFRCHWEQRRARKKAEGKLQDQEHQIADDVTGKPIETKKSLVGHVIEEKTGMDFDRFTRSILLAQGGFDTFLKADVEQKSKILEQITGTEIYSEISRRVHERHREEQEKLNLLNAETSGIVILQPEQEEAFEKAFTEKQQQEAAIAKKVTETGNAISWLTTIGELKKEIHSLKDEAATLKDVSEAFKTERSSLNKANKAASLDGKYATLTALRKQQADDQASLKADKAELPEHESSAKAQAKALEAAEQLTLKAKQQLKTEAPLIQKARSLDQMIAEQTKAVSEGVDACNKQTVKVQADKQARKKCLEKQTEAEEALKAVALYLHENEKDQWLISGLAGVEEQLDYLRLKQQEIVQKETDIKKADAAVADSTIKQQQASEQCSVKKQDLKTASNNLQQARQALSGLLGDKLLREYRTEKESLFRELALIQKIEALEDHRAKLEDGKPCPLCGSVEHPFAKGNVPLPNRIEQKIESLSNLIDKADEQLATIEKLEQAEINAQKKLHESEKFEIDAINTKNTTEKALAESKATYDKLRTDFEVLMQAVSEKLKPLGILEIEERKVGKLLESLKSRQAAWQNQVKQKSDIKKQITSIDNEVKQLDVLIDSQLKTLTEKQQNLERLKQKLADATDERKRLYGDKKPEDEEIRLNQAISDAEETEKSARDLNTKLQQKLTSAQTHIESMEMRIEQNAPKLRKAETDFTASLTSTGFADEKSFLDARLSHEERESLSSRAKELDLAVTELNAKQKDRETRLAKEIAHKHTDKTLEELELQFKEYEASLNQLRDAISGLKHTLKENSLAKQRFRQKQSAIETQKKECYRWQKLHSLIGSSDGKKYRNFAQGLTFELMVSQANRQLEKMTDRYLLIRDKKNPLELSVMDNYQAGEIRSTINLSGGESFIVSLCLALGLSKMASKNVRVDSLFLDEGFGTLDEDSLNTALDTLATLQEEGKLIGVISHISALKDRVSTQIMIQPKAGGRSQLTGPGCESVSG